MDSLLLMLIVFGVLCTIATIAHKNEEKQKKEDERQQKVNAKRQEQNQKQNQYEERQRNRRTLLIELCHKTMETYELLAQNLEEAEKNLNQAAIYLKEHAYAPFWSSIEKATQNLAFYDEGVRYIKQSMPRYINLATDYAFKAPEYPLAAKSIQKLDVATGSSKKLENMVRIAQRDIHFATIFEQRKTNQILVAGFTNLADAIDSMSYKITESINEMSSTLNNSMKTIESGIDGIGSRISELDGTLQRQHDQSIYEQRKVSAENAQRQKKIMERLDNIQRGRSPVEIGIHRGPDRGSPFYKGSNN